MAKTFQQIKDHTLGKGASEPVTSAYKDKSNRETEPRRSAGTQQGSSVEPGAPGTGAFHAYTANLSALL